jgi:hypothetical protein
MDVIIKMEYKILKKLSRVVIFACLFPVSSSAMANEQRHVLDCDRTGNIAWEAANDLIGAIPGIGDAAKFVISLSKIGNNIACNGEQITENRVEELAHEATHIALEDQTKAVLGSLGIDLMSWEGSNTLPPVSRLDGWYDTARDEEARISTLDYRALDIQVSVGALKMGFLNGLLAQVADPEQYATYVRWREEQASNTLNYLQVKESNLMDYLHGVNIYVNSEEESFCSDSPCYTEYQGVVEYPDGHRITTDWYSCQHSFYNWCNPGEERKASDAVNNLKAQENNRIKNLILNNQYYALKGHLSDYVPLSIIHKKDSTRISWAGVSSWSAPPEGLGLDYTKVHVADFDGDSQPDIFTAFGNKWYIKYFGDESFTFVRNSGLLVEHLAFGDFDGDGRTDAFAAWGDNQWHVSYSGNSDWEVLNSSGILVKDLGFGDFDGDGRTDVFAAWGDGQWHVSYGGRSGWQVLNSSGTLVKDLGFGDFDGDGRTDVLVAWGDGQWHVSYGGRSGWQVLNSSGILVKDLAFGDFDGDGRTDIFAAWGDNQWHVSYSGSSGWQYLNTSGARLHNLLFADLNGDKKTDVITR